MAIDLKQLNQNSLLLNKKGRCGDGENRTRVQNYLSKIIYKLSQFIFLVESIKKAKLSQPISKLFLRIGLGKNNIRYSDI